MNKKITISCLVVAGVIVYWLYRANLLKTVLPYLIIGLCPLMHLFMMKNMHRKDSEEDGRKGKPNCH